MAKNSLIPQNEEYLTKFAFAGKFCLNDITQEIEFKESENLPHNINGIYAICLNDIVKFEGECFSKSAGISNRLNIFRTGGHPTNTTYRYVHGKIKEHLKKSEKITVYFFKCSTSSDYPRIYQKIFGSVAKPEWNKKNARNEKTIFSEQLEKLLLNPSELKASSEKCREDEIISNNQLHINIKEFTRKYPEKIKALKNSKNKCALESLNRYCVYFERRNKITNIPNERYLEVHHLIPLSSTISNSSFKCDHLDKYENMVCLCGNCHNQIHYGMEKDVELIFKNLYELKEMEFKKVGLNIGIKKLISIYKKL